MSLRLTATFYLNAPLTVIEKLISFLKYFSVMHFILHS